MQMALVLITITIMLQFQIKGCVGCVETERIGLLQLKSYIMNVLSVKEETILKSWSHDDPTSDCCLWERVKCSKAIGGHIVDLSLDELRMYNSSCRSLNLSLLHSFPLLHSFSFSKNGLDNLFDSIHGYRSFQRLEKLKTLDLSGNGLNNSILPFLSAAKSLRTLNLGGNRLEGVFTPRGYKIFQGLKKLRTLDLSQNSLNNSILPFLSAAKSLETLNLGGNSLGGVIPPQGYKRLEKLRTLDLSNNYFKNSVFPFLSSATKLLRTLNLGQNSLGGAFPPNGLKHLVGLKVLRLTGNQFNVFGPIQVFKDIPKLQELDLSQNEFTDLGLMFPLSLQVLSLKGNQLSLHSKGYSEICRLQNLRELDLEDNALTSMPYCLGNLTRLRTLELSYNQLKGDISSFVSILPSSIEYLSLLQNNFNGSFLFNSLVNQTRLTVFKLSSNGGMIQPQTGSSWLPLFQLKILTLQNFILGNTLLGFLVHQRDLRFVDLSYNNLTGAFPTWLVQNNTRLQTLLLNGNSLTKLQLPRLAHGLEVLDISSNIIFDTVQEDIGIVFPNMSSLNFASNHFQGAIPSSMGEMKRLDMLDMSYNNLSGKLPTTFLSGCYSLSFLKLSNNQFQGEIFAEHTNLTGLSSLALDGNNFNGSLGKGLLNSKSLFILDISNNSISGAFPLWISRLPSLEYLSIRGNQLKDHFPRQLQKLRWLSVIDISHNSFFGFIPKKFDFPNLKELRLQSNEFMGTIPDTLFEAELLEVLDLGNNKFSGNIPNTIGKSYSSLRVLLLGNNDLQSHISAEICQLSSIDFLDLSHNNFIGVIPSCLSNMFGVEDVTSVIGSESYGNGPFLPNWNYTSALNFDREDVLHSRPTFRVDFLMKRRYETYQGEVISYMRGLDLSSNQLSGEIPDEIGNLENLLSLNLSSNRLTGSIPYSFSKLKDLESLDLSNNKLHGRIPPQLADLNNIGVFNVSWNNLSGEIPFKSHFVTFDEWSYTGNAHLCGPPTNKSCSSMRVLEPSASKQAEMEEEGSDGVIDMVWFYWTCGAVYISTALASFAFFCIDSRWSRECFYRVDLIVHHLNRFKGRFVCN